MTEKTSESKPLLTEERTDGYGTYTQEWYCQPPEPGVTYMVTDCVWAADHKTRRIYAIDLAHGRDKRDDAG